MEVRVNNLVHYYGKFQALKGISFTAKSGEILGFLGPNGAGKTTTMKIITCFLIPTNGEVFIGNYSIYEHPLEIRKIIGYLPENNPLYYDLITYEHLYFTAKLYGLKEQDIRKKILEVSEICGISEYLNRKVGELSKGYKQRVGLANILLHDPQVLILDEPTSGLDPIQVLEIRALLKQIGKQKTLILSTHILQEVEALCEKVVIIHNGQIVADDTIENLKGKIYGLQTIILAVANANEDELISSIKNIPGVESIHPTGENQKYKIHTSNADLIKKEIFNLCASHNWTIEELTTEKHKLEEIFKNIVQKTP